MAKRSGNEVIQVRDLPDKRHVILQFPDGVRLRTRRVNIYGMRRLAGLGDPERGVPADPECEKEHTECEF